MGPSGDTWDQVGTKWDEFVPLPEKSSRLEYSGSYILARVFCSSMLARAFWHWQVFYLSASKQASKQASKLASKRAGLHIREHLKGYIYIYIRIKARAFNSSFGASPPEPPNSSVPHPRSGQGIVSAYLMLFAIYFSMGDRRVGLPGPSNLFEKSSKFDPYARSKLSKIRSQMGRKSMNNRPKIISGSVLGRPGSLDSS